MKHRVRVGVEGLGNARESLHGSWRSWKCEQEFARESKGTHKLRVHVKSRGTHKPRVHVKSEGTHKLGIEGLKNGSESPSGNQKAHMSQKSMRKSRGTHKLEVEGLKSGGESPHKSQRSWEYKRASM
jgi:hypothetical protein